MTIITSKSNPLIKKTKKLLQKKYRKEAYLIEGWHLLEEAQKSGAQINHVFTLEVYEDRVRDCGLPFILVSEEVLKELAPSQTPQGVVAEVALNSVSLPSHLTGRYLVLEDVQDPGNVGTMIRTADAADYSGVILSPACADIYNPKTLRSMQGSHFHLPIYRQEMKAVLALCKASGLPVLASTLSAASRDYKEVVVKDNFALVMGNEGKGISEEMAQAADELVHITMPGQAESLNVAVAAGILMFSLF